MHRRARVAVGTLSAVVIAGVLVFAFRSERDEAGVSSAAAPSTDAVAGAAALADDTAPDVPGPTPRQQASAVRPADAAEWDERYRTEDLFSFAQAAAAAAIKGDGRAGWLLSLVLVECKVVLGRADRRDPALRGSLAEARLDDSKLERCKGFRAADPLDGLPDEAKRVSYWRELAIAAGDGRAIAYRALVERAAAVNPDMDSAAKADYRALILDDVRVVVATKDPEAIATLANVFLQPNVSRDPQRGFAWLIAACELGYDCSMTNPALRSACAQSGTCDGTTLMDGFRRSASAAEFAKTYAAAQDIAYNVRQGNWDALQPYLAMDL